MAVKISAIVLGFLVGMGVAFAQQEVDFPEAPLEDVWPAMSEAYVGDLDEMLERGEIRVLTTFTLGSYFIDRGRQHGTVYEMSLILEEYVREHLGEDAEYLKITIIPARRDQLLPFLIQGYGYRITF